MAVQQEQVTTRPLTNCERVREQTRLGFGGSVSITRAAEVLGVRFGAKRTISWRPRAFVICVATVAMMGVVCPWAMGLNPALDVSQYAHTGWKIRDGFTKGAITSIAQTPDGYLWLGTEFGLYRFDGVRAVAWQPPTGQKHPNDYVLSLLVSRDGTLWIGIRGGLASWRGETLKQYPQLADISFFSLLEDREGTVWAVGEVLGSSSPQSRLCALHDGQVQCYGEGGPFRQWVEALYEDREGNLWVGGADGLWRWRPGAPQYYVSSPIAR